MIIKTFDQGWDKSLGLRKFEKKLLDVFFRLIACDTVPTVVINSLWYTDEFHCQVMENLEVLDPERIVLVALLDASVTDPLDFGRFQDRLIKVGYYYGRNQIDAWALILDEYMNIGSYGDLTDSTQIDTAFMCLNRKPHDHRIELYQHLERLDLLDRGLVSMGGDSGCATRSIPNDTNGTDIAPTGSYELYGINNDIVSLGNAANWHRCFLNIVTETWFDINHAGFVSEKIYKPIVGCRPFLAYARDGGRRWLSDRGFKTFERDFDDITDLDLLDHNNIPIFLSILCQQPRTYWQKKYLDLLPKITYNKQRFSEYVQEQKIIVEKGIVCPI